MYKKIFLPPLLLGLLAQIIAMHIAWKHNAQCEIYCAEFVDDGYTFINGIYIDFSYWFLIGFSWFAITFLVVFLGLKIC